MAKLREENQAVTKFDEVPLNALSDIPDYRDRYYEPALLQLKPDIPPPESLEILNQGVEGACTGFGLAAVINILNRRRESSVRVSARMLYEMAKKFDAWPGEGYSGSSCRGAIKGWYSMGVCSDGLWPHNVKSQDRHLTVERAKDARSNTIGAYYRLRKNIVDMHTALNEVGAVFVSANVHRGWTSLTVRTGFIKQQKEILGGHAFAIIGYDDAGFWIQNSWGIGWGRNGIAHWRYEDWLANVKDAWVLQLALPTPQIWSPIEKSSSEVVAKVGIAPRGLRRNEIAGHFVHIDDGKFNETGEYWSMLKDVQETAQFVARSSNYKHVMFYAHGGLNSLRTSATRIAALKETFKVNGIYPFHFIYDTGLLEELKEVILGKRSKAENTVGANPDWADRFIEQASHRPGRALWREMKSDAALSFCAANRPGRKTMEAFLTALRAPDAIPKKIHLVAHSTGAILLGHLLKALAKMGVKTRISSISLFAPAATVEFYEAYYRPLLRSAVGKFGIEKMNIYNLDDEHELDDNVASAYCKSFLYLVSNSFEEEMGAPILGMERFSREKSHD